MAYCINCGEQYKGGQKFCRRCGRDVSDALGSFGSDSPDAATRALRYERTYWHLRRKRSEARGSDDSLQMYIGCIAVIACLHGLSLFLGESTGKLVFASPFGWVLAVGIVAGAGFKFVFDLRYGYSPARSLVEIVLIGVVIYALLFGIFWYLDEALIKSGKPLFNFTLPQTPTPRR